MASTLAKLDTPNRRWAQAGEDTVGLDAMSTYVHTHSVLTSMHGGGPGQPPHLATLLSQTGVYRQCHPLLGPQEAQ
jgi:hypothetical protein